MVHEYTLALFHLTITGEIPFKLFQNIFDEFSEIEILEYILFGVIGIEIATLFRINGIAQKWKVWDRLTDFPVEFNDYSDLFIFENSAFQEFSIFTFLYQLHHIFNTQHAFRWVRIVFWSIIHFIAHVPSLCSHKVYFSNVFVEIFEEFVDLCFELFLRLIEFKFYDWSFRILFSPKRWISSQENSYIFLIHFLLFLFKNLAD